MIAVLLSFAIFLYWSVLGIAFLTAAYSRRNLLRNLLLAPIAGASIVLLPVFWLNRLGLPVGRFGRPLAIGLFAAALVVLWVYRKRVVPWRRSAPFAILLIIAFFLSGAPMLEFGTNWFSYGNNDMANYVLGGMRFHDFGYFDIPDSKVFSENRDATYHFWFMHVPDGFRSGSELAVAEAVAVTGMDGFRIFMPLIFALHLAMVSACTALVLTGRKRRMTALVAMALMTVSALVTLGVVYQLIAQVFGLALMAGSAALIMRRFEPLPVRPMMGQALVIAVFLAALAIVYPEIVPFLVVSFACYQALVLFRNPRLWRSSAPLWAAALLLMAVFLNHYLGDSVNFLLDQTQVDSRGASRTETLFPFYLVPSGFANLWSLVSIGGQLPKPLYLDMLILAGMLLTAVFIWLAVRWAGRKEPVAVIAFVMIGVGAYLFYRVSNFGLYKLAMFIQPGLAGTMALALVEKRRWYAWTVAVVVAGFSVSTQYYYVERSRGTHGGLLEVPEASATHLVDESRRLAQLPANARIASDTFNVVVAKLQALYLRHHPLEFYSKDFFPQYRYSHFFSRYVPQRRGISDAALGATANRLAEARLKTYQLVNFDLKDPAQPGAGNEFLLNPRARQLPVSEPQYLLASTARQGFLNRRHFNEDSGNYRVMPLSSVRNHIVFISSYLGHTYYMENDRRHVGFFQLEPDITYPGRTVSATGRHILFQLLNGDPGGRLVFDYTTTWNGDHDNALPPAEVIGDRRYRLPVHGRGAARVFSPPLTPQRIGGQDYLGLDMGREGKTFDSRRDGLMNLFGREVLLDIRWVTGFARDISYVSEQEYQQMRPPPGIWSFPDGLLPRDLEYSGIYEDGWVSEDSAYTFTQAPDKPDFVVSGFIPRIADGGLQTEGVLFIDGTETARKMFPVGEFEWHVPVRYKEGRRAVVLKFSSLQHLPDPDNRPISAKLRSIGFDRAATTEDVVTRGAVTLGAGWYSSEKFNGETFRWVNNDAVFTTRTPAEIELEPGPGITRLPARVEIIAADGSVMRRELARREKLQLSTPSTYRIHVVNGGRKIAGDPRILNVRVFRIAPQTAPQADIALKGVRLGKGWHDVETQNGQRFRWADTNSEFTVSGPGKLRVEVEPGPSLGTPNLMLKLVDESGRQVTAVSVRGRQKKDVDLRSGGGRYRFVVESARKPVPNDPRILNFRVWEMSLQSP